MRRGYESLVDGEGDEEVLEDFFFFEELVDLVRVGNRLVDQF